ncbi:MAG: hypothetical protein COA99_01370 [Moraxellaceae bacterium]|nr:MAG: hypothetical protein COA99_01370 [Moraxellaceae bacterium]
MSIQNLAPLLVVGESTGSINLDGAEDFHAALSSMVGQAQSTVMLFTQELDPELYDQAEFIKAVSDTARSNKRCEIHILICNSSKVARSGHRLIELQKRLSSAIKIHNIPDTEPANNGEFVIVDGIAITHRFSMGFMQGSCEFKSPSEAQKKARYFDRVWRASSPCQEFRRLGI